MLTEREIEERFTRRLKTTAQLKSAVAKGCPTKRDHDQAIERAMVMPLTARQRMASPTAQRRESRGGVNS